MNKKVLKLVFVNMITLMRLLGAFLLPFIYYKNGISYSSVFILILFLSDAIDGFLARKLKASTFFGCIMDALGDKVLNIISFVILGLEYNIMFAPLVIEITIFYICYSTYRYGGNVKSLLIGKIKTVILDVFVILSFIILGLDSLNIESKITNFITNYKDYIINTYAIIILIACLIALNDYVKKHKETRLNPKCKEIKVQKKKMKSFKTILGLLFNTSYYEKHKNESAMKQLYIQ